MNALIAFGSNLADPENQVRRAVSAVSALEGVRVLAVSPLYRTAPVGYADQPDFINAAALVETTLDAPALLLALQGIERAFGRERSFRNAPRTLDLDIIDFNGEMLASDTLTLPHPRACERAFVMYPLADIAPDYRINGRRIADIAAELPPQGIERLQAA
ncbi:2-amino-4-hydroxy-6-hydroxymethyldihydropteridine diphosphokinase [Conchiformibius kuhniae]|uniref:2-amino-4-hydroxy-6-hydroxymethyldihydropteridine pyrophosphokinase n=1 Tax=Conchiformibius kuhniae TaxID=211502 RepID=A0ABD8B8D0_9NEIS|nr:2-amino-4-hydroxy-6-hydroxymethyldihydropteridine diphosphokinase [Conchiformibius kuhniae]